ncbi:hypothetical protein [Saccharomonospora azurea]|uniref:hypothetical protein n=1 Tax=Saccharomonospora azurea TaxID=40988 RepID=UPI00055E07C3|nr:hypothetical protein [Saccharomonospora azurea]
MLEPARSVLEQLIQSSNFSLNSDPSLVGAVASAAAKDDERRAKERPERGLTDNALRRKPELWPVPLKERRTDGITPWHVLHVLARSIALSRRGAARGLAEHWGALKYSQALTGNAGSFMRLSAEGKRTAQRYKAIQSEELGTGFALVAARRILEQHYPERVVSIVPADTALYAGWRQLGRYKPQYFAEVWKPGKRSLVIPIACKGHHSNASTSHSQLASASAHVEHVHIGPCPSHNWSRGLQSVPPDGPVTVNTLCAQGSGGWLSSPRSERSNLDVLVDETNFLDGIQPPAEGGERPKPVDGFHVTPDRYEWFARVLARTAAAGVTAFAGDGGATTQYLTRRQGREHFTGFTHAAAGSVRDACHILFGIKFSGTDHIFRLNGTRVEAFSGVANDLLQLLVEGRVERYRHEVYERRSTWPSGLRSDSWNGPVSIHADGTVLAMRILP